MCFDASQESGRGGFSQIARVSGETQASGLLMHAGVTAEPG
jgi:hypothetical protein